MRIIYVIIIVFIIIKPAAAEVSDYIDAFTGCCESDSYKVYSQVIKGGATISDIDKQFIIDREISKELGSNFIYTDLDECIKTALGENFDIKIQKENKNEAYWLHKNAQFQLQHMKFPFKVL